VGRAEPGAGGGDRDHADLVQGPPDRVGQGPAGAAGEPVVQVHTDLDQHDPVVFGAGQALGVGAAGGDRGGRGGRRGGRRAAQEQHHGGQTAGQDRPAEPGRGGGAVEAGVLADVRRGVGGGHAGLAGTDETAHEAGEHSDDRGQTRGDGAETGGGHRRSWYEDREGGGSGVAGLPAHPL